MGELHENRVRRNFDVNVGIGEAAITNTGEVLGTLALGSCVGIALYDEKMKISALLHIMLPNANGVKDVKNIYKYADLAIPTILDKMVILGANKKNIKAKIAGGASMFSRNAQGNEYIANIGFKNVCAVKEILNKEGIQILSEETGGSKSRTMHIDGESCKVILRPTEEPEREI